MKNLFTVLFAFAFILSAGCAKFDLNKSEVQHTISKTTAPVATQDSHKTLDSPQPNVTAVKSSNISQQPQLAQIYFASKEKDPDVMEPEKTYPVKTEIQADNDEQAVRQALEKLLKGPSETEKKEGYYTTIPEGTKINSIKIDNGTIAVDFSKDLNLGGGSCDMAQRRSQIENTVNNLPALKERKFIISVEGDDEKVLQP